MHLGMTIDAPWDGGDRYVPIAASVDGDRCIQGWWSCITGWLSLNPGMEIDASQDGD